MQLSPRTCDRHVNSTIYCQTNCTQNGASRLTSAKTIRGRWIPAALLSQASPRPQFDSDSAKLIDRSIGRRENTPQPRGGQRMCRAADEIRSADRQPRAQEDSIAGQSAQSEIRSAERQPKAHHHNQCTENPTVTTELLPDHSFEKLAWAEENSFLQEIASSTQTTRSWGSDRISTKLGCVLYVERLRVHS